MLQYNNKKCLHCDYVDFIGPRNMQRHELQYHHLPADLKKQNVCGICDIKFKNRLACDKHMELHDESDTDFEVFNTSNYREHGLNSPYEEATIGNQHLTPEDILSKRMDMFFSSLKAKSDRELLQNLRQHFKKGSNRHIEGNYSSNVSMDRNGRSIVKDAVSVKVNNTKNGITCETRPTAVPVKMDVTEIYVKVEGGGIQGVKLYNSSPAPNYPVKREGRRSRNSNSNKPTLFCKQGQCTYSSQDSGNFKRHCNTHIKKEIVIKSEYGVSTGSHIMSLRSSSARVYQCEHCSYATKEQGNYKRHINVHIKKEEETPKERQRRQKETIKCSFEDCSFETRETGNFSRHMSTHGIPERNKVMNKCHKCDFTAEGYKEINFHTLREHNEAALHQCEFCKEIFTSSVILKEHRYGHAMKIVENQYC